MDALIAKADSVQPLNKRPKDRKHGHGHKHQNDSNRAGPSSQPTDRTALSVLDHTSLPRSLRPTSSLPEGVKNHSHISNKKLRLDLDRQAERNARAKGLRDDAELLTEAVGAEAGRIEVDGELERTWRVGQAEIEKEVGLEAKRQRREWRLDGGPYRARYTRNGRHLAIVGNNGHVASFDWQAGTMHAELQLKETCRDITYLHDHSYFAVAQKKYVFIYDVNGVELHKLSHHVEPTRLEFLPYHWLLATIGNSGHLKYQDTSTGQLIASHRTGLGPCSTLAQNPHTAILHLGHQNGTVTLWTPNLGHPAVRLQAHLGNVTSVSVDPSEGGRYMATAGVDGKVKVWDIRKWEVVREWTTRGGGGEVEWSAKGVLAAASGGTVNVYNPPHNHTHVPSNPLAPPPLYLTHPIPSRPLTSLRFCPFTDVLTIGHQKGLSSILVPGSGEPNFDSTEADPYENRRMRREREVKGLLDKVSPELITYNAPLPGSLAPPPKLTLPGGEGKVPEVPFARLPRLDRLKAAGKYDATEEPESEGEEGGEGEPDEEGIKSTEGGKKELKERVKKKMRGKNKSMKRYLRKHRKNVIDPQTVAIRAKLDKQREERLRNIATTRGQDPDSGRKPSVLDRFRREKK